MNDPSPRVARISRVSQIIAAVCGFLLVLLPVLLAVLCFVFPGYILNLPTAQQFSLSPDDLTFLIRAAVFGAVIAGAIPMLWVLWSARLLFLSYAGGSVFSVESAGRLKHIAYALLCMVLFRPLGGMLVGLALSIAMPAGQKRLILQFGSDEVWIGLAGAMMLVIGWIMGEAAALADENKSFV